MVRSSRILHMVENSKRRITLSKLRLAYACPCIYGLTPTLSPEDPKADIQSAIRSCATPQEVPRCSASDPQQVRMVTACQLPSRGTLFCDEFNNGVFISRHLRLRRIIGKPVIQGKKYAASSHRYLMFSRRTAPRAEETICTFAASHSIT